MTRILSKSIYLLLALICLYWAADNWQVVINYGL
jgi:hypothetical protein